MHPFRAAVAHVRRQPVAYLALVVAMSGTAVAATPLVTSAGVANNSLTTLDVKNDSLTSVDVKNRSLLAVDFKLGQLPKGDKGDAGTKGDKGDKGDTGDTGTVAIGAWHVVGAAGEPGFGSFWQQDPALPLRFRREGDTVRIDGRWNRSAAYVGNTLWSNLGAERVIFTLPVGFRPEFDGIVHAASSNETANGFLYLSRNGGVYVLGNTFGWGLVTGATFVAPA